MKLEANRLKQVEKAMLKRVNAVQLRKALAALRNVEYYDGRHLVIRSGSTNMSYVCSTELTASWWRQLSVEGQPVLQTYNCGCPAGIGGMRCYHRTLLELLNVYQTVRPRDERGRFVRLEPACN